jgi:hypothetical protein
VHSKSRKHNDLRASVRHVTSRAATEKT